MNKPLQKQSCKFTKSLSDLAILELWLRFMERTIKVKPKHHADGRGKKIKTVVLVMPDQTSVLVPALDTAAPIRPPIKACEELLGKSVIPSCNIPDDRAA